MGLPFVITEGTSLLIDKNGNLADIVNGGATGDPAFQSSHGKWRLATQATLTGRNGLYEADVELFQGNPSLRTFGIQAIESLRGFDPQCDIWFYIGSELDSGGAGNIGDTVRVIIEAGDDPVLFPKVDVTYTLVASDVGDEEQLALNIANYLNNDLVFKVLWSARRIQGNGCVYITARKPGSQYERPNDDDFKVQTTGTTTATRFDDKVIRRNKITGLARDPVDPRQGQLGIQGSVVQSEGDVTNRFQTIFPNLLVDGSVTPVNFNITADPVEVRFITSVVLAARGNGIKFGQFLSQNTALTNGIQISFKTEDQMVIREPLKSTGDLLDLHAEDPDNFAVYVQAGGDKMIAVLNFSVPIEIRPQGEFTIDDYLRISVRDNLTSGITQLRAIVNGFNREF